MNDAYLCVDHEGKIDLCMLRMPAKQYGARGFWEEFRPPRPGEGIKAQSTSGVVTVLGAVVG